MEYDELIGAAMDEFDVDPAHAAVGRDTAADSDRVFIIETLPAGYRLIGYGLNRDDEPEASAMQVPDTAIGSLQMLLQAAGLHVSNHGFQRPPPEEQDISIRELAEAEGLSEPHIHPDDTGE